MKNTIVWDTIKWIACIATLSGAICTSMRIDPANIYLFNAGAVLYLVWSIKIREWNLIAINGGLLAIYGIGLFLGK